MQAKKIDRLGVMLDCSRNAVLTVESVKKMIDILSKVGYNVLELYTEDTFAVDGEPYFGYMRGRYTREELQEIEAYAAAHGMETVPCIQTLAHLNQIFRWPAYRGINDIDDILLAEDERTYAFIEHIFATLSKTFTSRRVHIGMDEAYRLGRGEYETRHGAVSKVEIMKKHLNRVAAIADKYGFTCQMWSDMFIRMAYGDYNTLTCDDAEHVAASIPKNVQLVYWDYYRTDKQVYLDRIDKHVRLTDNLSFAGGAWAWAGFCPHNAFSLVATKAAFEACYERGIGEILMTVWGDNGAECSPFSVLPTLIAAACYAKGKFDDATVKKTFREAVGIDFDAFMTLGELDKIDADDGHTPCNANPCKYMLYNDPFMGVLDSTVEDGKAAHFTAVVEKLERYVADKNWGYLFAYMATLGKVMEIKYDLGIKTRAAYAAKDKKALQQLAENEYTELETRLRAFYDAFEAAWNTEKKPHGFDVQDVRLGGLMQRVAHCKKRLLDYAAGRVAAIPELEEELLDYAGGESFGKRALYVNHYAFTVTSNIL